MRGPGRPEVKEQRASQTDAAGSTDHAPTTVRSQNCALTHTDQALTGFSVKGQPSAGVHIQDSCSRNIICLPASKRERRRVHTNSKCLLLPKRGLQGKLGNAVFILDGPCPAVEKGRNRHGCVSFTVALRGQERHHLSAVVPMGLDGGLGQSGPGGQESSSLEMSVNRN